MSLYLGLLLLLSAAATATAVPLSDLKKYEQALIQMLKNADVRHRIFLSDYSNEFRLKFKN